MKYTRKELILLHERQEGAALTNRKGFVIIRDKNNLVSFCDPIYFRQGGFTPSRMLVSCAWRVVSRSAGQRGAEGLSQSEESVTVRSWCQHFALL